MIDDYKTTTRQLLILLLALALAFLSFPAAADISAPDIRHEHTGDRVVQLLTSVPSNEEGLSYQWEELEGTDTWVELGHTSIPSFDNMSVVPGNTHTVRVTVTNAAGESATSEPYIIKMFNAPEIIDLHSEQRYDTDTDTHVAMLSGEISSEDQVSYQWQQLKNGEWVNIEGATSREFNHMEVEIGQEHTVRSVATNSQLTRTISPEYSFTLRLAFFTP